MKQEAESSVLSKADVDMEESNGDKKSMDTTTLATTFQAQCTECTFLSDYDTVFQHGVADHKIYICVCCSTRYNFATELMVHLYREHKVPPQRFLSDADFVKGGGQETLLCCVECSRFFDLGDEKDGIELDDHDCNNSVKNNGVNGNHEPRRRHPAAESQLTYPMRRVRKTVSLVSQDSGIRLNVSADLNGTDDNTCGNGTDRPSKETAKKVTNEDFVFEASSKIRNSNSLKNSGSTSTVRFSNGESQSRQVSAPSVPSHIEITPVLFNKKIKTERMEQSSEPEVTPTPKLQTLKLKLKDFQRYSPSYEHKQVDEEVETKLDPLLLEEDSCKRLLMLIEELFQKLSPSWPGPDMPGYTVQKEPDCGTYKLVIRYPMEENVEDEIILTEMLRKTSPNCTYCSQVKLIKIDKRQLVIHLLSKHFWTLEVSRSSATEENGENGDAKSLFKEESLEVEQKSTFHLKEFKVTLLKKVFLSNNILFTYKEADMPAFGDLQCECLLCGQLVDSQQNLFPHWRKIHRGVAMKCAMCQGRFLFAGALYSHLCFGTPNPVIKNETLPQITGGKHPPTLQDGATGFGGEVDIKHENGSGDTIFLRYQCSICENVQLPGFFNYMVHLRKEHTRCELCLEGLENQKELERHMKKHKLNHFCWKCGVTYCAKPNFMTHLFWKHGSESKECSYCLKKKWPHIYHFCVPPQVFSCDKCDFYFTKPKCLVVHRRLHTGEKLRKCPNHNCVESFISKKLLDKHIQVVHNPAAMTTLENADATPTLVSTKDIPSIADSTGDYKRVNFTAPQHMPTVLVVKQEELLPTTTEVNEVQHGLEERTFVKSEEPPENSVFFKCEPTESEPQKSPSLVTTNLQPEEKMELSDVKPKDDADKAFNIDTILGPNLSEDESGSSDEDDAINKQAKDMKSISSPPNLEDLMSNVSGIPGSDEDQSMKDVGGMSPLLTPLDDFTSTVPDIPTFEDNTLPEHIIRENAIRSLHNEHDYCLKTTLKRGIDSLQRSRCSRSPKKGSYKKLKIKTEKRSPQKQSQSSSSSSSSSSSCGSNCSCSSSSSSSSSSESDDNESNFGVEFVNKYVFQPQPLLDDKGLPIPRGRGRPRGSVNRDKYGIPTAKKRSPQISTGKRMEKVRIPKPPRQLNPDGTVQKRKYKRQKGKFSRKSGGVRHNHESDDESMMPQDFSKDNFLETDLETEDSGSEQAYNNKQISAVIGTVPAFDEIWTMSSEQYLLKFVKGVKDLEELRQKKSTQISESCRKIRNVNTVLSQCFINPVDHMQKLPTSGRPNPSQKTSNKPELIPDSVSNRKTESNLEPTQTTPVRRPKMKIGTGLGGRRSTSSCRTLLSPKEQTPAMPVDVSAEVTKGDELYCWCQSPHDNISEMIGCDSEDCEFQWFHFECVGITVPPKGKWYCSDCKEQRKQKSVKRENDAAAERINLANYLQNKQV